MAATMGKVVQLPGLKQAPRSAPKSRMDTMLITPDSVAKWRVPPFQRPLKVNAKVLALSEALRTDGGVVPGIVTLGTLDHQWYIVDGQHRMEAFRMAELKEGLVDVRIVEFESMADMADEFAQLNDSLVRMMPDDRLRALETSVAALQHIRKVAKFVGYGGIRRGPTSPLVSMTASLRVWVASGAEVPQCAGANVVDMVKRMTVEDAQGLCDFLGVCFAAWGSDPEHHRLWAQLNLTLLAWLWRRTVVGQYTARTTRLSKNQFIGCCMALSARADYVEWLLGRTGTRERDRSPCYGRLKAIFLARLQHEGGGKVYLPAPDWASNPGTTSFPKAREP